MNTMREIAGLSDPNVDGQGRRQCVMDDSGQHVHSGKKNVNGQVHSTSGAPVENIQKSDGQSGSCFPAFPKKTEGCLCFLPASGNRNGTDLNNRGENGNYWSGTQNTSNDNNAYNLNFNSDKADWNNNNRRNGHIVRPVAASSADLPLPLHRFHLTREQLLVDLIKAYFDARRHKRNKLAQIQFEMNMENELVALRDDIWNRTYQLQPSTCFVIHEPKAREILAADFRDRVVHHLLYNYISPLLERCFITDSYSCRVGRGTHYGIKRLEHHIRQCSDNYKQRCWVMKMDIKGYFMSISRQRLENIVRENLLRMAGHRCSSKGDAWSDKIDFDLVLYLCRLIILSNPLDNCVKIGSEEEWADLPDRRSLFKSKEGYGLPIGNLTSQLFSNVYLNSFDQYMKRNCRCKHYGRYVDDFFVVSRDRQFLKELREKATRFLREELELDINPQKTVVRNILHGVDFLGAYLKPHRVYLRNSTVRRVVGKIKTLADELPEHSPAEVRNTINSYLGMMGHYRTFKLRHRLFAYDIRWDSHGLFNYEYSKFYSYDKFLMHHLTRY